MKDFILIILCICSSFFTLKAQELNPEFETFINSLETMSLEEVEEKLDKDLKGLKSFASFYEISETNNIKDYTKEEERFTDPFKIDISLINETIRKTKTISFSQYFKDNTSFVKFNKKNYLATLETTEGIRVKYTPKEIYYKNGSSNSKTISDYKISFYWHEPWGSVSIMDSIFAEYKVEYVSAFDLLALKKTTKKVNYKSGAINIKKIKKNYLYLTVNDAFANKLYVRALNSEGKPLMLESSSSSDTSEKKSKANFETILKQMEVLKAKLKAKTFKDIKALKEYIIKQGLLLKNLDDTDGVYHKKIFFQGNIETVNLFIATEKNTKTMSFIAKNDSHFGNILMMQTKKETVFLNSDTEELFRIDYIPVQSLGSRYYEMDGQFYHLNLKSKTLDSLQAKNIFESKNGLAFIEQKGGIDFSIYNSEYQKISNVTLQKVVEITNNYVLGIDGNTNYYILDAEGTIKKLKDIVYLSPFYEGRFKALGVNENYGFIDTSGKTIVPFKYKALESFSEGLAVAKNDNGLYGYIDLFGKEVLPFKYKTALSFKNGIALVAFDGNTYLISKEGKILVKSSGYSYSVHGLDEDRIFTLGGKQYDTFGKLISK